MTDGFGSLFTNSEILSVGRQSHRNYTVRAVDSRNKPLALIIDFVEDYIMAAGIAN
jgi:hypothetical protein